LGSGSVLPLLAYMADTGRYGRYWHKPKNPVSVSTNRPGLVFYIFVVDFRSLSAVGRTGDDADCARAKQRNYRAQVAQYPLVAVFLGRTVR